MDKIKYGYYSEINDRAQIMCGPNYYRSLTNTTVTGPHHNHYKTIDGKVVKITAVMDDPPEMVLKKNPTWKYIGQVTDYVTACHEKNCSFNS